MSSAAQRNDMAGTFDFPPVAGESTTALKEVVAERLAAHRNRRVEQALESAREEAELRRSLTEARQGAKRVRDAVTARYQERASYREFLAAEAERALQQAQAEAEMAARKAKAVAEVQLQLLEELEQWKRPESGPREVAIHEAQAHARGDLAHALADIAMGAQELIQEPSLPFDVSEGLQPPGAMTVRLYEELVDKRAHPSDLRLGKFDEQHVPGEFELDDLEQEIAFRRAPEFEPHIIETTPIPANLIEFPRQLIAARKARPRLAEGPLREEVKPEPQLRIFEVEAEQISIEPATVESSDAPEWQTLVLGGGAVHVPDAPPEAQMHFTLEPQTAPLELRLMAAAVDGCCLLGAFVGFAAVVAEIAGPKLLELPRPLMGACAGCVLLAMYVLYQMLFFSFAEATPGMRYARIGLCTFSDQNPTRKAMRRRVLATLLAASPLGIGLAWAFMDEQRLGWHDRMSRMYQRAY
ncbi:MAG TPA: RDD family protein [Acidobacteriaceae bacterium]